MWSKFANVTPVLRSKGNQTMKFETRVIFSFKNHAEKEVARLVPDLLFS